MAVIDEVPDTEPAAARALGDFQHLFWEWYAENKDRVIFEASSLFGMIKWKVRVRDLRPLFAQIFG